MKQFFLFIIMGSILYSCENFLEVGPNVNELDVQLVFENDNTAEAALNGIYSELQKSGFASGNTSSITFLGNNLVDDAIEYNYENDRYEFYQNKLYPNNEANYNIWSSAYKQVYNVNAMLEGVEKNINLSQEITDRIIGESLFIRAFVYYYLVHLYDGGATSTYYRLSYQSKFASHFSYRYLLSNSERFGGCFNLSSGRLCV